MTKLDFRFSANLKKTLIEKILVLFLQGISCGFLIHRTFLLSPNFLAHSNLFLQLNITTMEELQQKHHKNSIDPYIFKTFLVYFVIFCVILFRTIWNFLVGTVLIHNSRPVSTNSHVFIHPKPFIDVVSPHENQTIDSQISYA